MASLLDNPVWRTHLSPYAAELVPHYAAIAREVVAIIHERVPEIGNNPVLAAATYSSGEANIQQALTMLRDGISAEGVVPPPAAVAQAREYVVAGAEVASLQRTYRIGHELFWNMFVAPLRDRIADPTELSAAMSLATEFTFQYIDAISTQIVEIYSEERERWVRSSAALRADTVRAILSGTTSDAATASRRLGYDLARPHLAFVVWCDPTEQDMLGVLEERATRVAAALGARSSLLVPLERLTIGGWISTAPSRIVKPIDVSLTSRDVSIHAAVGSVESGLEGFRMSHVQALQARRFAELNGSSGGGVEFFDRIALVALTTQDPQLAHHFVANELGPLNDGSAASQRLSETISAYLAEGSSPARAAKRLGIHENTVANRIAKAETLLGYPVERRRLELALALRMQTTVRALNVAD